MIDTDSLYKLVCGHPCVCLYDNIKVKTQQYKEHLTCVCFIIIIISTLLHCFVCMVTNLCRKLINNSIKTFSIILDFQTSIRLCSNFPQIQSSKYTYTLYRDWLLNGLASFKKTWMWKNSLLLLHTTISIKTIRLFVFRYFVDFTPSAANSRLFLLVHLHRFLWLITQLYHTCYHTW